MDDLTKKGVDPPIQNVSWPSVTSSAEIWLAFLKNNQLSGYLSGRHHERQLLYIYWRIPLNVLLHKTPDIFFMKLLAGQINSYLKVK